MSCTSPRSVAAASSSGQTQMVQVVLAAVGVKVRGRLDGDTVDVVVEALDSAGQRNRCITLDLVDVAAISDAAVKMLFCYQLEQQTRGGRLTILCPPRLQRRLAVCDTTLAPGRDGAADDALVTTPARGCCPAPRPAGASPMRPGGPRRGTGGR